jgi:FkbM family methyltransferase
VRVACYKKLTSMTPARCDRATRRADEGGTSCPKTITPLVPSEACVQVRVLADFFCSGANIADWKFCSRRLAAVRGMMAHEYYYLGKSTALAKINGSESFVCIDTNSWESLIYAQGYPVEPHEVGVMRRFLSPGDVFLDVGANFGLYSAVASEILAHSGSIYSFEANPHTYTFLRKTALANRLLWLPQHKFLNVAIGPHDGETQFAYTAEALGGGHIVFDGERTDDKTVTTVRMAALDNLLPKDLVVNFCKMDVEGHELGVLQGMTDVIRRSSGIRLLIEHYTGSEQVTESGKAVVDFARSQGLSICIVGVNGELVPVEPPQHPTGNVYLLATRTPEEDVSRTKNSRIVRPSGLQYHAVFRDSRFPLFQSDGSFRYQLSEHSGVDEPALFFGPYIELKAGNYRLRFIEADGRGTAHMTLCADMGSRALAVVEVSNWSRSVEFSLPQTVTDFEIVLRKGSLKRLAFKAIEIESL